MNIKVSKLQEAFFSTYPAFRYSKGKILLSAFTPATQIYYLKKGHIRQYLTTAAGEEITFHVFRPIAYFPIMLSLSDTQNVYSFEALTTVEGYRAPVTDVIAFLKKNPEVLFDLTTRLSRGITGLLVKIENQTYKNAYLKVVSLLIHLTKIYGEGIGVNGTTCYRISLPLSQANLATWVGLQRETLSRQIEILEKRKIIAYEKHYILIRNFEALQEQISLH
ncbi:MAG: Crp/Fnr family transcriptional regulator [Candidatus Levybacteria bacterium]|nr:Crp/Fnr family transcriptional regulator [Candidatus Levybacteria bacterium]